MKAIKFLLHLSNLIGLDGAADKVTLDQALMQLQTRIVAIAAYHQIPDLQRDALQLQAAQELTNESFEGQIEERTVNNLADEIIEELEIGFRSKTIKLPHMLRLPHLYYLKSSEQNDSWSCGYWSVFNASAIQYLVDPVYRARFIQEGINGIGEALAPNIRASLKLNVLDIKDIQKISKEYFNLINFDNAERLPQDRIVQLPNLFRLNNVYVLGQQAQGDQEIVIADDKNQVAEKGHDNAGGNIGDNIYPVHLLPPAEDLEIQDDVPFEQLTPAEIQLRAREFNERMENGAMQREIDRQIFFADRKQELVNAQLYNPKVLHFICNLDAFHWILISIVKKANRRPFMVVIDSLDLKINPRFAASQYIMLLYNKFIAPDVNQGANNRGHNEDKKHHNKDEKKQPAEKKHPEKKHNSNGDNSDNKEKPHVEKKHQSQSSSAVKNNKCSNALYCAKDNCILRCAGCKVAFYCSEACQTQHWKRHKLTCQKSKNNKNLLPKDKK